MRRLMHKLFRRHRFEPFELEEDYLPMSGSSYAKPQLRTEGPKVWYVGFRCSCGEPGFKQGPLFD